MELVKKHAQTFIALCTTGGCLRPVQPSAGMLGGLGWLLQAGRPGLEPGLLSNLGLVSQRPGFWGAARLPSSTSERFAAQEQVCYP